MNTWWYIHVAALYQLSISDEHLMIYTYLNWYQLSCTRTRDDIYIPQLYIFCSVDEHVVAYTFRNVISTINFPIDEHVKIYANCNFISTWDIHTATLYQLSCRWTRDDIYIPQLYIDFPADEHVMRYTYCNFISTFLPKNTWWDIHTATLFQLSCRWTRDDIYILQLYMNFPIDEHLKIYANRNFILTFMEMNTW